MPMDDHGARERERLAAWALDLLPDPFDCPSYVGASYAREVRELEWGARPLWAVFSLMAGGDAERPEVARRIEPYIAFIRAGLTPGGPRAFPDPARGTRQVVVEMQPFAFGLIACGDALMGLLDVPQRERLAEWLLKVNDPELPWGAWHMYRLFVNAALRHRGLPYDADRLDADVKAVEAMYAGGGWYEDGTPFQRDYHIPLAFHVLPLLLERFCGGSPVSEVMARAQLFARDFSYWFDDQGRSLPFGRSQVYRFVHASFWSALALAGEGDGMRAEAKDLLMRNLSWWRSQLSDQPEGLTLGYAYPNIMVGEDYSGPGAPYIALQALIVLALPAADAFWRLEPLAPERAARRAEERPGMLFQRGARHVYALSAMQYSTRSILQRMSKYGKLCYSTAFGWNVSRDVQGIENFAVDSALAVSIAGTGQFVARSRILGSQVREGYVYSLWAHGDVARVETWLVPVDEFRHVRVHRVDAAFPLETFEGGFPVFGWNAKRDESEAADGMIRLWRAGVPEGERQVCGIADGAARPDEIRAALLAAGLDELVEALPRCTARTAEAVRQNPDTNIYDGRSNAVPALRASLSAGEHYLASLIYGDPGADSPGTASRPSSRRSRT